MAFVLSPLNSDGPTIPVDKPILVVGRHVDCDVSLNASKVSRRHCCIGQIGESLVIKDLGSTNGFKINGKAVIEAVLHVDDKLTIAHFTWTVGKVSTPSRTQSKPDVLTSDKPIPVSDAELKFEGFDPHRE